MGIIAELGTYKEGNLREFFQIFDVLIFFITEVRKIFSALLGKINKDDAAADDAAAEG